MDKDVTIESLKAEVKEFCELRDWDQYHNAKDLAIGIITEASELLENFRFKDHNEQQEIITNPELKNIVSEELADVLFFVFRFAQRFEIDLSTAFRNKMDKNKINYPVEKSKGLNKKYSDL